MFSMKNGQILLTRSASGWQELTNNTLYLVTLFVLLKCTQMALSIGTGLYLAPLLTLLSRNFSIIYWKKELLLKKDFYERSSLLCLWSPGINPGTLCYVWHCCTRTLSLQNFWVLWSSSLYLHSCRVRSMFNF